MDEQCEEQALPVRLSTQRASQGLLQGPLLRGGQRKERYMSVGTTGVKEVDPLYRTRN